MTSGRPWFLFPHAGGRHLRRHDSRESLSVCKRTVSLLPEFALPYLRPGVSVTALFLITRLLEGRTLAVAVLPRCPRRALWPFWVRRFRRQAEALAAALAAQITSHPQQIL